MTITLDDELLRKAWDAFNASFPGTPRDNMRAAITAYLQGAVEAGKAWHEFACFVPKNGDFTAPIHRPVLILPLPPQNPSSAESSSISE
jgi:hypothetical protein